MRNAALALLGLWLPGVATATSTPTQYAQAPRELLQRFDANGSGDVDASEYLAYLALGFSTRDADGNGVLEGEELPPGARPITRADHEARLRRQFTRQDANRDGVLDGRELLAPPRA